MYIIKTEYRNQGKGVVGHTFDSREDAEAFLIGNGWRPDKHNIGKYTKEGKARMVGMIGVSVSEYVSIEKA